MLMFDTMFIGLLKIKLTLELMQYLINWGISMTNVKTKIRSQYDKCQNDIHVNIRLREVLIYALDVPLNNMKLNILGRLFGG